nr:MAG: hypothetical protein [Eriocheir sinensis blumevirus 1]
MEHTNYNGQTPKPQEAEAQNAQFNTENPATREIVVDGVEDSNFVSSNPISGSFHAARTEYAGGTVIKKILNDESAVYIDTRDPLGIEEQIVVRSTTKKASTVYNSENGKRAKYLSGFAEKGQYKNVSFSVQGILRQELDGTDFDEIIDYPVKSTLTLEVPHDAVVTQELLAELTARVIGATTSQSKFPEEGMPALADSCDKMMSLVRGNIDLID